MDCEELVSLSHANLFPSGSAKSGDGPGILLVEDQRLVLEVACEILRHSGYRVYKAANATAAACIHTQHSAEIAVLITDVALPDGRGPELATRLRADGGNFQTILMSGYPEALVRKSVHLETPFFYLSKPFAAEGLIRRVKQALSSEKLPEAALL